MKYELKLVYKTHILGPVECKYRSVVPENRYEATLKDYHRLAKEMKKDEKIYDSWLLVNRLDDDGVFVETVL